MFGEGTEIQLGRDLNNVKIYSSAGRLIQQHVKTDMVTGLKVGFYILISDEGKARIIVH